MLAKGVPGAVASGCCRGPTATVFTVQNLRELDIYRCCDLFIVNTFICLFKDSLVNCMDDQYGMLEIWLFSWKLNCIGSCQMTTSGASKFLFWWMIVDLYELTCLVRVPRAVQGHTRCTPGQHPWSEGTRTDPDSAASGGFQQSTPRRRPWFWSIRRGKGRWGWVGSARHWRCRGWWSPSTTAAAAWTACSSAWHWTGTGPRLSRGTPAGWVRRARAAVVRWRLPSRRRRWCSRLCWATRSWRWGRTRDPLPWSHYSRTAPDGRHPPSSPAATPGQSRWHWSSAGSGHAGPCGSGSTSRSPAHRHLWRHASRRSRSRAAVEWSRTGVSQLPGCPTPGTWGRPWHRPNSVSGTEGRAIACTPGPGHSAHRARSRGRSSSGTIHPPRARRRSAEQGAPPAGRSARTPSCVTWLSAARGW